ncbi:altered inheritance of mitochondria protein 44-like [Salarias fasciatus]|uniref:altered inheritance of mitochondria protein 44-like n=1 Tax=Salarias fasciatus TaxID=181472 RepID=UPI001176E109|nr:altered inheritance of mitochondria protein 44-like [Salarias fasciatus]
MENRKKVPCREPFSCAPKPKRCRTDSPLEEAILKDLAEDMEARRSTPSPTGKADVRNKHEEGEVTEDPAHAAKKTTKGDDKTEETGNIGDEEEEDEEEEEDDDEETPVKGGFLTRLASYVFPFSLFSRNHSRERHGAP